MIADDALRVVGLEKLGGHAPELAREALESGVVEVEPDVLSWEGSGGLVHGHRVRLGLESALSARVKASPSAIDALTAALAAAMSDRRGNALAELVVVTRAPRRASPYR